jgi:lipopolysaccharide export system protein LptA
MTHPMFRILLVLLLTLPLGAFAEGTSVAFKGLKQDTTLPVEVTADSLAVDQATGVATFSGNVRVAQGALVMTAGEIRVEYAAEAGQIAKLHAKGGVTFANAGDAAEATEAIYTIDSGSLVMSGNVLLTQGKTAISGQKLAIDLKAGSGVMEGRVQTVFQPKGGN